MAIDTDEKKFSSILMWMPFRMSTPIPSQVGFTDAQMQQMLYQYSGISWGAATLAAGVVIVKSWVNSVVVMYSKMTDVLKTTFEVE
jgi:hypothetical protein